MIRFIHAADIHLDSPLKGLGNRPHLPKDKIKNATREALKNLVNLAISEKVDFVLLAGDIYDGKWDDVSTGFQFIKEINKLQQKNIPVIMISGNHDAESKINNHLSMPSNLKILQANSPESHEVIKDNEVIAIIHGQSFLNQAETRNLAANYPPPVQGKLNIGILHTSLTGYEGHENYAPTTKEELINKGYSYWALGHVHTRQEVNLKPYIIFPGNIQGRHIKEIGAKGCYLVTFKNNHEAELEFKPLDVFRWKNLSIDLSYANNQKDLEEIIKKNIQGDFSNIPVGIRVVLKGETSLHSWLKSAQKLVAELIQSIFENKNSGDIFLEQLKVETSPPIDKQIQANLNEDIYYVLEQSLTELINNPKDLELLIKGTELDNLSNAIPGDWKDPKDSNSIHPINIDWLKPLLTEIVPVIETSANSKE